MTLLEAVEFARRAHGPQKDKGGRPYWHHPVRVMVRLGPSAAEAERYAALLHDVVEDTALTMLDLKAAGFSAETLAAVDLLTRDPASTYSLYLDRLIASKNVSALRIKLADLIDNMSPERAIPDQAEHERLFKRHQAAEERLRRALDPVHHDGLLSGALNSEELSRLLDQMGCAGLLTAAAEFGFRRI